MKTEIKDVEIKKLNDKIDFLTDQVMMLTSRMKTIDALKEDASMFAKDAYNEVVLFFDQVDSKFRGQHVVDLMRKILINMENFSNMMNHFQSAVEFWDDTRPLAKEMFNSVTDTLYQLEQYRFFESIQSMINFPVKFNEAFSPEDIHNMEDSAIRLMKIFNRLARPETIEKIEEIVNVIEDSDIKIDNKVSVLKVMKKLRSKEVLKNVNLALDYIKLISKK